MDALPDPRHQIDTEGAADRCVTRCGPSQYGPGAPHGPVRPTAPSRVHMVVPQ